MINDSASMHARLFLLIAGVLVLLRVPSLVQPMGADQGLYAYIGERILAGDLPYREAWDQKPPAIHYTYAVMRAIWPDGRVVAAADLLTALLVALLVYAMGSRLWTRTAGQAATLLYLFLSDPGFQRLAGVSVRAQCETFIAALAAGSMLLLVRNPGSARAALAAGTLIGTAAAFKYNAAAYVPALFATLWALQRLTLRSVLMILAGCSLVPLAVLALFASSGALRELYDATITYNLLYSGETYRGAGSFAVYLLTFPIQHARVDGLWLLGGAGCAVLLAGAPSDRTRIIVPAWVAAACLTIAINGSRGLPQYFVQAAPALALAAAGAGALLWSSRRAVNLAAIGVLAFAVWRVNDFSNLAGNLSHEGQHLLGGTSREVHLERYGDRTQRKYSALAMAELADFIRQRTEPADPIYIFGFASAAYVEAGRESASRFFWSRPVIVDFNAPEPGYGVAGLRQDLERKPPVIVALQLRDWEPDVQNSADFFYATPQLADWLYEKYDRLEGPAGFDVWMRRGVER